MSDLATSIIQRPRAGVTEDALSATKIQIRVQADTVIDIFDSAHRVESALDGNQYLIIELIAVEGVPTVLLEQLEDIAARARELSKMVMLLVPSPAARIRIMAWGLDVAIPCFGSEDEMCIAFGWDSIVSPT